MLKFGNKEFRNLQEQVKKNMDDILFILQEEGVLNEFGIKVVGQESTIADMPTVADYKEDNPDWSYGDAYAIGTEEPYELYILTRANGTHPNDYWFNIGTFPAPGPQGPQGEQGDVGPQGPTGNPGTDGVSPVVGVGTVSTYTLDPGTPAYASVFMTGTQANPSVNYNFYIPRGQDGSSLTSISWGSIYGSIADQTDLIDLVQGRVKKVTTTGSRRVYGIDDSGNQAVYTLGSDIVTPLNLSGYATQSYVSSAISGVNSTISSLNYLSVGALSSETYIPRVGGDNDGTYWTAITLGDDTYSIPQGGVSSVAWGSISGTLSNQTDLQDALDSKLDKEVTAGNDSSSIDIDETVIGLYSGDSDTNSSLEISKDGVVIQANDDVKGTSTQLTVSDGSVTITRDSDSASIELFDLASMSYVDASIAALSSIYADINSLSSYATVSSLSSYATVSSLSEYAKVSALSEYATISAMSSAIDSVNSTISSLNYASVGALSSDTVIPNYSAGDWIGISNSTISVYNPYVSLMSDGLPRILMATTTENGAPTFTSQYVDINPASGFRVNDRKTNPGNKYTTYGHDNIIYNSSYTYSFPTKSGTFALLDDIPSAQTIPSARSGITLVGNYYGLSTTIPGAKTFTGWVTFSSNAIFSHYVDFNNAVTFNSRTYFPDGKFMYGSNLTTGFEQQLQSKSGTIALLDDIPSVSEYATISALSSAIDGLSSVYAPLSDYASQAWVSANFLSSGYVPVISGYASLSGNNEFTGSNTFTSGINVYGQIGTLPATNDGVRIYDSLSNQVGTLGYNNNWGGIGMVGTQGGWPVGLENRFGSVILSGSTILIQGRGNPAPYVNTFETWTFTLSDNTTVSKTILVG